MDLSPHPHSPASGSFRLSADVVRSDALLSIRYVLEGPIAETVLPDRAEPLRTNELWRHTCFEAFLRSTREDAYAEFNFAPSSQWAAYRFEDYRSGMADLDIQTPTIAVERSADRFVLAVSFRSGLEGQLDANITAVIEHSSGTKSYWALAHPPGDPDFHHPDCFALELPAPEAP